MRYRTGFQCPVTGLYVIATYAFGKVNFRTGEHDLGDMPEDTTIETLLALINTTDAWCKQYGNKRIHSVGEASDYVVRVSDGQAFGFYE